jgi:hypothetical protein
MQFFQSGNATYTQFYYPASTTCSGVVINSTATHGCYYQSAYHLGRYRELGFYHRFY